MLLAWCVFGCGTTDLEVVERLAPQEVQEGAMGDDASDPSGAPSAANPLLPDEDGGACGDAIVPLNRYLFRSQEDGRCLAAAEATTIGGFDAFETGLSSCDAPAATWQLVASTLGSFEIRNVLTDFSLDVERANIELGTSLVLFAAHGGENQKFVLSELADTSARISPRSANLLCVQGDDDGVYLGQCTVGESTQKWYIVTENCP